MDVYQFMIDIYEKDWRNGVPAPFLEYALSSDWMDKSLMTGGGNTFYEKIGFKPLVHWTFWEKKILAAAINSTD